MPVVVKRTVSTMVEEAQPLLVQNSVPVLIRELVPAVVDSLKATISNQPPAKKLRVMEGEAPLPTLIRRHFNGTDKVGQCPAQCPEQAFSSTGE